MVMANMMKFEAH